MIRLEPLDRFSRARVPLSPGVFQIRLPVPIGNRSQPRPHSGRGVDRLPSDVAGRANRLPAGEPLLHEERGCDRGRSQARPSQPFEEQIGPDEPEVRRIGLSAQRLERKESHHRREVPRFAFEEAERILLLR